MPLRTDYWYYLLAACLLLALAYGVYWTVGPTEHLFPVQFAIGLLAVAHGLIAKPKEAPPALPVALRGCILAVLCYVAWQTIPLPLGIVRFLSPSHGDLLDALRRVEPDLKFASISVAPAKTMAHLMRLCTYVAIFLLVRDLSWRLRRRVPWASVLPLLLIGGLEATLGLAQFALGGGSRRARGTYVNADHFAGLLEMCLPFACLFATSGLRGARDYRGAVSAGKSLRVGPGAICAALIFAGIVVSGSRMGLIACLLSAVLTGWIALARSRTAGRVNRLWLLGGASLVLLAAGLALVAPAQLVTRFANLAETDIQTGNRLPVWRATLHLIRAYPVFGCGLGAYESAFLKFKPTPLGDQTAAHNDYLQLTSELGIAGVLLAAIFPILLLARAYTIARRSAAGDTQSLALAAVWAIAAILIHSLADFNLYIEANAMVLAWVFGVVAGLATPGSAAISLART